MRRSTVLFLAANPEGTQPVDFPREAEAIRESLRQAGRRDSFELEIVMASNEKVVRRAMQQYAPSIVHFSGHGTSDGSLIFESELGQVVRVAGPALADFFEAYSEHLICVILNACNSETAAEEIGRHIDYVIGVPEELEEDLAIRYATAFYDTLGTAGRDLRAAHEEAVAALGWDGEKDPLQIPALRFREGAEAWPRESKLVPWAVAAVVLLLLLAWLRAQTSTTDQDHPQVGFSILGPIRVGTEPARQTAYVEFGLEVTNESSVPFTLDALEITTDSRPHQRQLLLSPSGLECWSRDEATDGKRPLDRFPIQVGAIGSLDLVCRSRQKDSAFGFRPGWMTLRFSGLRDGERIFYAEHCILLDETFLERMSKAIDQVPLIFNKSSCDEPWVPPASREASDHSSGDRDGTSRFGLDRRSDSRAARARGYGGIFDDGSRHSSRSWRNVRGCDPLGV